MMNMTTSTYKLHILLCGKTQSNAATWINIRKAIRANSEAAYFKRFQSNRQLKKD